MNFDIIEVVRQKQHKQQRSISIENGQVVDIDVSNDKVIVTPRVSSRPGLQEEIEPAEIVPLDD
jgi:antitoxin component of MazEF toxin-antitoxin module